ncbi:sulfotransferase family protein [Pseudomonas sp. ODNR1LW]|nr:sulfotransferase family protein [Pseudomonas sp. ODNR1LW]
MHDAPRPRRLHITGAPRSGTTLLHVMILTCFDVDGPVEAEQRLRKPVPRDRRLVCTKCPGEVEAAAAILNLDPRLDVVYLSRDPREVVTSEHAAFPGRYFTNLRVWRRAARAAARIKGHPRFHLVDYRRLVTEPDFVQIELMTAMPWLRPLRPFSQYHLAVERPNAEWTPAMRTIRPVCPSSLGGWRRHLPRLQGQLTRHGDLADELIALGFETDRQWMRLLDGVTPDLTPSVNVETPSLRRRLKERLPRLRDMALYLLRNRSAAVTARS